MGKHLIGLDSGTSGIKAILFDLKGNEIYKTSYPLTAIHPKDNWFEEDIDEIWENAKCCISQITKEFDPKSIIGIGITAQGDGLWMLDKNGNQVRNGCCFCDGRASKQYNSLKDKGIIQRIFSLTGNTIFTGNQGCILKWMEENEADSLEKAEYIMHLKDVLFFKLTGSIASDATDQSLTFIDMQKREYNDELFDLFGLTKYKTKYPKIKSTLENKAHIKSEVAVELGLSAETIVTSGPMDVVACALGAGVMEKGHGCSIIGTAALHEMVIEKPCHDDVFAGMTVAHIKDDKWLRLMASMAATPNLEWVIKIAGLDLKSEASKKQVDIYQLIEEKISSVPIGANGVIYHPYILGGERAPFIDFNAKASFTGLTVNTTAEDLLRACYEGVAYAMLDCYNNMAENVEKITICGGGAGSRLWCQMFADVVGKTVVTVNGGELGARGAAITNAVSQGLFNSFEDAVKSIVSVKETFACNDENNTKYKKYFKIYKRTYEVLKETWAMRNEE